MKLTGKILIICFGLILWAPLMQMCFNLAPEPKLVGYTKGSEYIPFRWSHWSKGKFQAAFDRWLQEHLGLRAAAVKTDCQINYSLFNESAIKTADVPVIGRDGYLYSRCYVDAYTRRIACRMKGAESYARDLRALQDELNKRGIAFVFVITPSKAEVYPEYLPPRYLPAAVSEKQSDYEKLLPALKKAGVTVIDGHAMFIEWKAGGKQKLFPPGSAHWQEYAEWRLLKHTMAELEHQLGKQLAVPLCKETQPTKAKGGDLSRVLNIWTTPEWPEMLPNPSLAPNENPEAHQARFLAVGDSFMLGLAKMMDRYRGASELDFYYYFGTHYSYPSGSSMPYRKGTTDWNKKFSEVDAVIIESNEILLEAKAWGFVNEAMSQLRNQKDAGISTKDGRK